MDSITKVERCFDLAKPSDRSEIPIYPQIISAFGAFGGVSQYELIRKPKTWADAVTRTFERFGKPDIAFPMTLGDVIFCEGLEYRRPGYELADENAQFQFIETSKMDEDDYRAILEHGWGPWFNAYMQRIQNPPMKNNIQLTLRWIKLALHTNSNIKTLRRLGVVPLVGTACYPTFDQLSLIRSFEDFLMDLYDEPELVKATVDKATDENIAGTLTNAKRFPVKRIQVYAMRSDTNSISPELFDEFAKEPLFKMIRAFHEAGYRTVLHCDGNWNAILDRFLELPRGCVSFEFDGVTDIRAAYDVVGGYHSMRGDVPATMMAFGTPDEVAEYCEGLVSDLGMRGGFILGTGCELSMDAKPENFKALMGALPR